jgi:thioester reductase-like protein
MSTSSTILFTGFPGFLGRELLPRVLERRGESRALCLVQGKFMAEARAALAQLAARRADLAARVDLAEGDITRPGLGLAAGQVDRQTIHEIHHLAAVYDLSVGRDFAMKVNVEGTRHVLDFAENCPALDRLHYVSTCYVSGRHAGIFSERDLDKGQRFNNFYEETKYLAEVLVRAKRDAGLPTTIYRPSIVVGDSTTGETQKLDGPYYLIRWLLRQPERLAFLPVIGDPSRFRLNVVPRDFVVEAIARLAALPEALGKTYQLADPEPPTCEELLAICARESGRKRTVPVHLPVGLAKALIERVPGVDRVLQIPSTLVDYMVHPTHYDTRDTAVDLARVGLAAPHFRDYAPRLVAFVRQHLDMTTAAMV